MAVAGSYAAVAIVNPELTLLVATHSTPLVNRRLFRIVMAAGALRPAPLYIPATVWVRDYVMCLRAFAHVRSLGFSRLVQAGYRIDIVLMFHAVERRCGCQISSRLASILFHHVEPCCVRGRGCATHETDGGIDAEQACR
jgi:hypothetical protein